VTQSVHHAGSWDWDCSVALEYAAEQLSKLSQRLTCDIAPSTEALSTSYLKCLSSLLPHEGLLPKGVAIRLHDAQQECLQMQQPNVSRLQCDHLASHLLTTLRDVSNLLAAAKLRIAA
jgi:hypothetical protein